MSEEIVVTGIGMAMPLGSGREECWGKIKEGRSVVEEPAPENLAEEFAPFVRFAPLINLNGIPRIFSLAGQSVAEALADSGLNLKSIPPERIGCSVSVSKPILSSGSYELWKSSFSLESSVPDSLLQWLVGKYEISGPAQNIIAACATGVHSLMAASRWLKEKRCDAALAGSVESSLHPLFIAGFKQMGVLSGFPCPFDKRRDGFIMGEGAGILMLERKEDALARGAKIYAELLGCAIGSDFNHPMAFAQDGSTIASVIERALAASGMSSGDIDYINLHGTGTRINDLTETRALKKVFGKKAYNLSLSSTKAATGHLLGASGSLEAGICCLAIRDQFVPPTANLEQIDPECDLDYTAIKGKNKKINSAVSFSFGFGGPIGAVVFRRMN